MAPPMPAPPVRVAVFTDSYYEANGVARTAQALEAFAAQRRLPLLLVHGGPATQVVETGSVTRLELGRSAWSSFSLEHDLRYDLALWRHLRQASAVLAHFQPDVIHMTGPSDVGQIGVLLARLRRLPLVGAWHTNVHEYAGRRLMPYLDRLHVPGRARIGAAVERATLDAVLRFYGLCDVMLAPNAEWMAVARERLGKPAFQMTRGVDTETFTPARRSRADQALRIGYVGRLSAEKSVRELARLERALVAAGAPRFQIVVVGDGAEREWLRSHLSHGLLTGTLRGSALADAYAGFDLFAFPSVTETVGQVMQEALASGVPVVAMNAGGPKYLLAGAGGAVLADSHDDWIRQAVALALDADRRRQFRVAARQTALTRSWSAVFETVYQAYAAAVTRRRTGTWTDGHDDLAAPVAEERAAS
ncbi:MAG: glycosyltransferase [Vicinamibacterales bacterium]